MRPTVLLVDDDANLRDGLRRALYREPWDVLAAGSALEALAVLASRPVDVVISDQAMPDMSGLLFLTRVCRDWPDAARIMLTGHGSLELARRAISDGQVYRFFTKPCDPEELKVAVRHGLEQRALLTESRRLLHTVRRQAAAMGLGSVTRDADGAVVLDDLPTDPVELLQEIQADLDAADARLRTVPRGTAARGPARATPRR